MPILCEEFIAGREITVGVVGNCSPVLVGAVETVNAIGEPLNEQILDLQAKRQGSFKKIRVDLSSSSLQKLREVSLELMKLLGSLDYATFYFPGVKEAIAIMAPATLSSSLTQINMYVDLFFASYIPHAAAALNYAGLLAQTPKGILISVILIPLELSLAGSIGLGVFAVLVSFMKLPEIELFVQRFKKKRNQ